MLCKIFEIKPEMCYYEFQAIKKAAGEDFVKLTSEMSIVSSELHYSFLTPFGIQQLDFILMYMHQNMGVKRIQFLGHLANLLLIFMSPAEVFYILKLLVQNSVKIKSDRDPTLKSRLRWHVPTDAEDHAQLIATFIDIYLDLDATLQHGIIQKCLEIDMNFDLIIHSMLNSLMTSVMPLDVAVNLCFVFLNEGQKVLFRFMLATL